VLDSAG
jgi:hypothetical protein